MQKSKYVKKCRHMKLINFMGSRYCTCKSKKGGYFKYNPTYENIIRRFNLYVMGSQNYMEYNGNWWSLCVNGKDPLSGRTPSNCTFY